MPKDNEIILEQKIELKFVKLEKKISKTINDNFQDIRNDISKITQGVSDNSFYIFGDKEKGQVGIKEKTDKMYEVYEDWETKLPKVNTLLVDWDDSGTGVKALINNLGHWNWLIKNIKWIIGLIGIGNVLVIAQAVISFFRNNKVIEGLISLLTR